MDNCILCTEAYQSNGKYAFCSECCIKHKSDLCEIITHDSIFILDNSMDVENKLTELKLKDNIDIRLDLHDVLDTTEIDEKLSDYHICCISYVGVLGKIRMEARMEIKERILSGQILYGVLIFKRGRDKHTPFTDIGSKAWFNMLLNNNCNPLFVDDSTDHVISVESIGIKSVQKFEHNKLKDLIQKHKK